MGTDPAAHVPGAVEVQVDDGAPAAIADPGRRSRELTAGVVDEKIEGAKALHSFLEQVVYGFGFPDIGRYCKAIRTGCGDFRRRGDQVFRIAAGDDEVGAEASEGQGNVLADAAATAGDQGGSSAEEFG